MLWYYTKAVRGEAHGSAVSEEWTPRFEPRGEKKGVDKKKAARYNKRHGEMPNGP